MNHQRNYLDAPVTIRYRLAGLWIAATFCYVYADILAFYDDYLLGEIIKGNFGPLGPITQELKFAIGVFMSIPAIMVWVSLAAAPVTCRWVSIGAAALFTAVSLVTTVMSPDYYYMYFGVLEIGLTGYAVWLAWKWPVQSDDGQSVG